LLNIIFFDKLLVGTNQQGFNCQAVQRGRACFHCRPVCLEVFLADYLRDPAIELDSFRPQL